MGSIPTHCHIGAELFEALLASEEVRIICHYCHPNGTPLGRPPEYMGLLLIQVMDDPRQLSLWASRIGGVAHAVA